MRLASKTHVAAPVGFLHGRVTDFDHLEALARSFGATVERQFDGPPLVGCIWDLVLTIKQHPRQMQTSLADWVPDQELTFDSQMQGLHIETRVTMAAEGAERSRLNIVIDMRPQTLKARVLLQTLRLARHRIEQGFDSRLEGFATDIGKAYRRTLT